LGTDFSYYVSVGKKASALTHISTEQRARVFKALSDPTRLRMVEMLLNCEQMCGSEIAEHLGISLALLCHHGRTLEHSGLIVKKKQGQAVSISVNRELLAECFSELVG
jgi:ArsR family transcriptional regulator, arsenate/arsenite/antimonite-responsive transcriptional repressor